MTWIGRRQTEDSHQSCGHLIIIVPQQAATGKTLLPGWQCYQQGRRAVLGCIVVLLQIQFMRSFFAASSRGGGYSICLTFSDIFRGPPNSTVTAGETSKTILLGPRPCHLEDGNGYYERINQTLTWNWVHNSSQTSTNDPSPSCIHQDYLEAIMSGKYSPSKPLAFLVFGDSLDRNTLHSVCDNSKWDSKLRHH
jgi:hypothetical protein